MQFEEVYPKLRLFSRLLIFSLYCCTLSSSSPVRLSSLLSMLPSYLKSTTFSVACSFMVFQHCEFVSDTITSLLPAFHCWVSRPTYIVKLSHRSCRNCSRLWSKSRALSANKSEDICYCLPSRFKATFLPVTLAFISLVSPIHNYVKQPG